jgi:hypothetical protein
LTFGGVWKQAAMLVAMGIAQLTDAVSLTLETT